MMHVFRWYRWVFAMVCVVALGIPTLTQAQVSSTEQAVMDKILKLKGEIDQLMMKPGSSSDTAAMEKVMDMKRDMDTFLDLLPPHLQTQVQKKMAQTAGQMLAVPLSNGPKPICADFVKDISRQCEQVDYGNVW